MQVVILAGGTGTRLKEMTEFIPKPMVHIGGKPMLWHIMKLYAYYGFKSFILALGYKQEMIKEYFRNYHYINNDIHYGPVHGQKLLWYPIEDWEVILSDTGEKTFKGGRLKRIEKYITDDTFMCTYGDSIGNIDIQALVKFHKSHGKMATVTGVHPPPRFGEITYEPVGLSGVTYGKVISFSEKPMNGWNLINGGFFVFNKDIFKYLTTDEWCDLEIGPLELIAAKGEMMVYHHQGYWSCMDTLKDMGELQQLWDSGNAPWRDYV